MPGRLRPITGIIIFGVSYLVATIVTILLASWVPIRTNTAISAIVLLGISAAQLKLAGCSPLRYVGIHRFQPKLILYSALASLAIILPTLSLEAVVIRYFKIPEELIEALAEIVRAESLPELLYVWLVAALGAAASEEFVFRGILQNCLGPRVGGWIAVLLTASVFGILHTIWRFPPAFILGIFLGLLYWRTGSLVPALVAHLTINTVAIVIVYLAEVFGEGAVPIWLTEERPAPIWMIALSLLVFAGFMRSIWGRSPAGETEQDSSRGQGTPIPVDPL